MRAAHLRQKYGDAGVSVIVAVMDGALLFLRKHELFPGVPVVAFTQRKPAVDERLKEPNLFRIWDGPTAADTVATALHLHPRTRQILVVSGKPRDDSEYEREVLAQLRSVDQKVQITYATDLPADQLLARVTALPPDALVLWIRVIENLQANRLPSETFAAFSKASPVPLYVMPQLVEVP